MPFDFAKAFQRKKDAKEKSAEKKKAAGKKTAVFAPLVVPANPPKPERARGKGSGKHGLTKAQQIKDDDIVRSVGKFKLPSLKDVVDDKRNMQALMVIFGKPEVTEQAFGNYVRNALKDSQIKSAIMEDDYWNEIEEAIGKTITFEERMYRTIDAIRDVLNGLGDLEWKGDSVMEAMLNYAAETGVLSSAVEQLIPVFNAFFRSQGSDEKIPKTDNELRDWILKSVDPGGGGTRAGKYGKMHAEYARLIYVNMLENFSGVMDDFFEEVQDLIKDNFAKRIPMQETEDVVRRLWSIAYVMGIQLKKINKLIAAAVKLNDPYSTPKYSKKADNLLDRVNTLIKAFNSLPSKINATWARHDMGALGGVTYNEKYKEVEGSFDVAVEGLREVHSELAVWDGTRASGQKMMSRAFELQQQMLKQIGDLEKWLDSNDSDAVEMSDQEHVDTINDLLS